MDAERQELNDGLGQGTIRTLIADDHSLLREALREVLEKQPDIKVIAEASNGEEAVRLALQLVPDVVIMDIGMPKLNGLEATRQIKKQCPDIAVLVLTVYDDTQHVLSILEAGAMGYLTKSVFSDSVIRAIRGVASGETVLSSHVSSEVIKRAIRHITKPLPLDGGEKITPREQELLRMIAKGMSNKNIAQYLNLSLQTIKVYLAEIFSKFNVNNRTEAVITALRIGILKLEDIE